MRLASKNEMLTLMGDRAPYFANYCLSDEGAVTKFLFEGADNYDLDLPVVQEMVTQLYNGGILDDACLERFAKFGQPEPETSPISYYSYRVALDYPLPIDADVVPDTEVVGMKIITVKEPISGMVTL